MPKNYQPPNLHVLPRNMAHLYMIYSTLDFPDFPIKDGVFT